MIIKKAILCCRMSGHGMKRPGGRECFMIRFIQLVYFVETVDRGSFSAAARSLYVSQSALSQSVAGLEEELGAELIRRNKSGVRMTYIGHRVYEEARKLIDGYRGFESDVRALLAERGSVSGRVQAHTSELAITRGSSFSTSPRRTV